MSNQEEHSGLVRKTLEGIGKVSFMFLDELMPIGYMAVKGYLTTSAIFDFPDYDIINADLSKIADYTIGTFGFSNALLEGFRFLLAGATISERIHPDKPYQPLGGIFPVEFCLFKNLKGNKSNGD